MADDKTLIFELRIFDMGHEAMSSELANVSYGCEAAGRAVRSAGGGQRSGVILGAGAVEIGEWTYTPGVAAS
jgi:hypothetical protein